MSTFAFKAVDLTGRQAKGELEAETKQQVAEQLKARGLIVIDIADKKSSAEIRLPGSNKVSTADLTIMTRQLATMVSSGMTILKSLYVLESQTESKPLADTLGKVRKDVEAGLPFSDALDRHPKVFSPLFVAMARAGETGGVLESALIRTAEQLEADESLKRQVKSAMVYPGVIMTFAFAVLIALVVFLVPIFEGIFEQFGGELPLITKVTVWLSDTIIGRWYLLILGTAGVEGFLGNLDEFYEAADLEGAVWRQFVEVWAEKHGETEVAVSDLFALALTVDGFDFGKGSERSQKTTFGKAIGRQRDRVIGDHRIAYTRSIRRAKHWRLIRTRPTETVPGERESV